jgi:hypothetical protein
MGIVGDVLEIVKGKDTLQTAAIINSPPNDLFSAELMAAVWAFDKSDVGLLGPEETNIDAHLDMLANAGAQFEHYKALKLSMSISNI